MNQTVLSLAWSLLVAVVSTVRAEPAGDPATRPVTVSISTSARPVTMGKGAWLGVTTLKAPQVLLDKLKIRSALIVGEVGPASPAAVAGLKSSDLIQKFDDQLLINPAQLQGLIRLHSPGDSVSLTVFRDGASTPITVKLVEHDVLPIDDTPGQMTMMFDGSAGHVAVSSSQMDATISDGKHQMSIKYGPNGSKTLTVRDSQGREVFKGPIDTDEQKNALPADFRVLFSKAETMSSVTVSVSSPSESSFSDGKHQLSVKQEADGKKTLTVRDLKGTELFKGPVDTDEQKKAIPAELRPLFEEMRKMEKMTKTDTINIDALHRNQPANPDR